MSVDASAVARVLGIATNFKDLRVGSVVFLPQRVAVIAQGASASSYSSTKFQATRADAVGAALGYGSPAHLVARQLLPANGDGVGTIPVTFYPLQDGPSAVAAVGDITPSGTQTKAASYRVEVNNVRSADFVVPVGAISVTSVCKLIGDAVTATLECPAKVTYAYGTPTSVAGTNTGNGTCTSLSVTGSPVPGAHTLKCNTSVTNGGVFTLTNPNGVVVSTTLTMTPGVGGTTVISSGGIQFTLTDGTTDFAVNDSFTITVPVTKVNLTAKWKGVSSNALYIKVVGDSLGTTFTITQPTGGLVNPTVDAALAQIGNVWESMMLNALNVTDTTALDTISTFGEGRWGALVRKPLVSFVGVVDAAVATATVTSSARTTDRVNAQLVSPGSLDLPFVVAARQLARIVSVANNNPARDYGSQRATGLTPGDDGSQWLYADRDTAVKAGSSTIEVKDGVVCVSDVVTFYRPTGENPPAFRHVCDIVKLQNAIFNIDLAFANTEWDGAPLIPDAQPTVNKSAKKPKMAKATASGVVDALALQAIISDPDTTKKEITAAIDGSNPKRLNMTIPIRLSGNANIVDIDLNFGFYFGAAAVVA